MSGFIGRVRDAFLASPAIDTPDDPSAMTVRTVAMEVWERQPREQRMLVLGDLMDHDSLRLERPWSEVLCSAVTADEAVSDLACEVAWQALTRDTAILGEEKRRVALADEED